MLAPDSRTILVDHLSPPPGFHLEAAVATTFTLDLTATLLPALAFTGFSLDGEVTDPIATLESVRSTADRIDVYCQAGAITVPGTAPDLLAFLEPMIHPVRPPRAGLFHPKVWFIKFADEEETVSYRLLVLTRNLTMDTSWDLSVRLDSERLSPLPEPRSAALGEFLRSLPEREVQKSSSTRRSRVLGLAAEAEHIVWEPPHGADAVLLHFLDGGRDLSMDLRGSRHLVVSPFVDAAGLAVVSKGPLEILSRAEHLDALDDKTLGRLEARVLDELAVSEAVEGSRLGGHLHAKMYVVEQVRNWSKSHVFIGSTNATGAGFSVNTEFMVEVRGRRNRFGIDRFLGPEGAFTALTESYEPTEVVEVDPLDELQREVENALRRIAAMSYVVEVLPSDAPPRGMHDLRIKSERAFPVEPGWSSTAELLTLPDHAAAVPAGSALDAVVPSVSTGDITPFLAIRVESPTRLRASTVVVAELVNEPTDRLDVVLARQIDSPEKFLRFLSFLLSLGDPRALAGLLASSSRPGGVSNPFGSGGSGVLEMVLSALAAGSSALADLDALVRRLESTHEGRSSLPEGFTDFWAVVREAADLDPKDAS